MSAKDYATEYSYGVRHTAFFSFYDNAGQTANDDQTLFGKAIILCIMGFYNRPVNSSQLLHITLNNDTRYLHMHLSIALSCQHKNNHMVLCFKMSQLSRFQTYNAMCQCVNASLKNATLLNEIAEIKL